MKSVKAGPAADKFDLKSYLDSRREIVEAALDRSMDAFAAGHPRLKEAMRYSLLAGGKRLRPILAMASCEAAGGAYKDALTPAVAIEYVHTYSLIHDDLPAMDDAELRRGKKTCHTAFDEATAILAGDALLTESFNFLAEWGVQQRRYETACKIVGELARAAGALGMVSGQAFDLEEKGPEDIEALDRLHSLKTGAMIRASVRIGALVADADENKIESLSRYAEAIGLAFQIVDDLLDDEGENTGKDKGKDSMLGKKTYPAIAGREGSRKRAVELVGQAKKDIAGFGAKARPLAAIADFIIERKN